MSLSRVTIQKERLLLVEGKDDRKFLTRIARLTNPPDSIQIIEIQGTLTHPKLNAVIFLPDFNSKVKALGIVRDADTNFSSAFQSVTNFLTRLNLPSPGAGQLFASNQNIKVGVFIFPNNAQPGALENLILGALNTQYPNQMQCVASYLQCLTNHGHIVQKQNKANVHSFLATYKEPGISLGDAALENYWSSTDSAFTEIKSFLQQLIT